MGDRGGVDALCRVTYCGFYSLKLVSEAACKPFDRTRNGLSLGEAGGLRDPRAGSDGEGSRRAGPGDRLGLRGRRAPHDGSAPRGRGRIRAMKAALEDAGNPAVDYVNADGTAHSGERQDGVA